MRASTVITLLVIAAIALFVIAAGCSNAHPVGPTLSIAGPTSATVDLPPSSSNSCPIEAPSLFTVDADGPVNGLTKFTFDWRRTGAATYILETRRRELNVAVLVGMSTLTPRENGTLPVRYFIPGIYHFRLRGNCPGSLWSEEIASGGSGEAPTVPPVPVPTPTPTCFMPPECSVPEESEK